MNADFKGTHYGAFTLYILVILFICNFVVKPFNIVCNTTVDLQVPIVGFTVFYILLGHYLSEEVPHILKNKRICFLGIITLVGGIIVISILFSSYNHDLLSYNSPIISAIAMLLFCFTKGFTCHDIKKIWKIDRLCFGVYLIHPVLINMMYKLLKITPVQIGLLPFSTVLFGLTFILISFIIAGVMYKINILKKYVL